MKLPAILIIVSLVLSLVPPAGAFGRPASGRVTPASLFESEAFASVAVESIQPLSASAASPVKSENGRLQRLAAAAAPAALAGWVVFEIILAFKGVQSWQAAIYRISAAVPIVGMLVAPMYKEYAENEVKIHPLRNVIQTLYQITKHHDAVLVVERKDFLVELQYAAKQIQPVDVQKQEQEEEQEQAEHLQGAALMDALTKFPSGKHTYVFLKGSLRSDILTQLNYLSLMYPKQVPDKDLLGNPVMRVLLHRVVSPEALKDELTVFLKRDHPLKQEVFEDVDALPDWLLLRRADEQVMKEHELQQWPVSNRTFRRLFIEPTVGTEDLIQLIRARSWIPTQKMLNSQDKNYVKFGKDALRHIYTYLRALEIMSRQRGEGLFQKEDSDLGASHSLINRLLTLQPSPKLVEELIAMASLMNPMKDRESTDALQQYDQLLRTLETISSSWRMALDAKFHLPSRLMTVNQALAAAS
jgi:hypothetical protein